jgi:hypothetical protein
MVLLLDLRYNKDPYSVGADGDFLGETQWEWLDATLRGSSADAHIIMSTLQVLPSFGIWLKPSENWARFPKARQRLLSLVEDSGVAAPIFLSGDVHLGEISEAVCTPRGSPKQRLGQQGLSSTRMVEITSSGVTHSWGHMPHAWIMSTMQHFYRLVVPQPFMVDYMLDYNFGELEFANWDVDPSVTIRIITDKGKTALEQTYLLAELGVGPTVGPNSSCVPIGGSNSEAWNEVGKVGFTVLILCTVVGLPALGVATAIWYCFMKAGSPRHDHSKRH